MSKLYDNWERLVDATLKRQKYRELALASSIETSFSSSISSLAFDEEELISINQSYHGIIEDHIRLAEQVVMVASGAVSFKKECMELESKAQQLAFFLNQVAHAQSSTLHSRFIGHIMYDNTKQVLKIALNIATRCVLTNSDRAFADISIASAFPAVLSQLEQSASWFVQRLIGILDMGSASDQCEAANVLAMLAGGGDDSYRKLIVKEGGVESLWQVLNGGNFEGKKSAARAIDLLAKSPPGTLEEWFGVADWPITYPTGSRRLELPSNKLEWMGHSS